MADKTIASRTLAFKIAGFADICRNGEDAPCVTLCPYGLDVRGFIQKVKRGSIRGAYNSLSEQLLFPATLCSICKGVCKSACSIETGGTPIDLPSVEMAVVNNAPKKGAQKFRVQPKDEKIAVVGAGLAGISAAYVMSSIGYHITLFEKNSEIGGSLKGLLSEEIYLPELKSAIEAGTIDLITDTEIKDIKEVKDFNGVIIATGANGNDFGLCSETGKNAHFAQDGTTFLIGERAGAPLTKSYLYGKTAAQALDRYIKAAEIPDSKLWPKAEEYENGLSEIKELTKEEAVAEASRCLLCDCTKCADMCELLSHYKKLPKRLEIDIQATLNPVEQVRPRTATRLIASCDDCGLCEDVCPDKIKTREVLMAVRTAMSQDKALPAAFHDFWMRDMAFSCSEKADYLEKPENGILYFPGCLLGGSDPENVTGSYALLKKFMPGSGIWLHCCGIPAKWAGETAVLEENTEKIRSIWEECGHPVFVTACPSCKRNLREFVPEIEVKSIYTIFAQHKDELTEDILHGEEFAVFHPCSSRTDKAEQESVKELIRSIGGDVKELDNERDRNGCCGYGGHIYYTNPGLYDTITKKRADSDERPYITYCANCRDVLTDKGKDCSHILKLLSSGKREMYSAPTLTKRRENRIELKAILSGKPAAGDEKMKLVISDELIKRMDRSLILNSDIESVVRSCEEEQHYLINEEGAFIGHKRLGKVTYWVTWKRDGETVEVLNAYSHRMEIEGE